MNYYYALEDRVVRGPVFADVLVKMHRDGKLHDDSPVIAYGESTWTTYAMKSADLAERSPGAARYPVPPQIPTSSDFQTPTVAPSRIRISRESARIAAGASETKDEFEADSQLRFPELSGSQGILAADPAVPMAWRFFVRVTLANEGRVRIPQLYIVVSNRDAQGLVMYNQASLSGGQSLKMSHITYSQTQGLGDTSWIEEHIGIILSPALLAQHLDSPLRIKVSRPDEGISFVLELPSYYIAGVLAKLDPDKYEIDYSSAQSQPAGGVEGHGWHAVAAGIAVGLFFMVKERSWMAGIITGVLSAAGMYGAIVYERAKKRRE